MARGRVKWFSRDKGYGFIERDDNPRDVFVHRSEVVGLPNGEGLRDGEVVEFEIILAPKGEQATNVVRLREEPAGRFAQASYGW